MDATMAAMAEINANLQLPAGATGIAAAIGRSLLGDSTLTPDQKRAKARELAECLSIPQWKRDGYGWLRATSQDGSTVYSLGGYPTPFTVECEERRECFAVFPDGRRVPLAEAEAETEVVG